MSSRKKVQQLLDYEADAHGAGSSWGTIRVES